MRNQQLPLDRPVTCQDIVTLTIADVSKRTYVHGNGGIATVMVHAEYLAGIEALNAVALKGNVEQTKAVGRDVIQVVKRILATSAEQEQLRATTEQKLSALMGQPVQVELVPRRDQEDA